MEKIFLSHSSADKPFVETIAKNWVKMFAYMTRCALKLG